MRTLPLGGVLRHPLLHFLIIGAVLFALGRQTPDSQAVVADHREPLVVSAEEIRAMRAEFQGRWGRAPSARELRALIDQAIDEEVLYREARRLALDYQDASVRRRLLEKMRLLSDRPASSLDELLQEATRLGLDQDVIIRRLLVEKMRIVLEQDVQNEPIQEHAIREYIERHREAFVQPATVSFSHLFLSANRSEALASLSSSMREPLKPLTSPEALPLGLSDAFPLGLYLRGYSKPRVEARFGKAFAEQIFALPTGVWSDPIASLFGVHFVWIHEQTPESSIPESLAREQALRALLRQNAEQRRSQGMARLRALYGIRIATDGGTSTG
ncbi:PPIC-type PPIASE domain-containing protein [Gammaproteobacteria bacterium]